MALVLGSAGASGGAQVSDAATCPGTCSFTVRYSIDSAFSEDERAIIHEAAHTWQTGSGGRACFEPGGADLTFIRLASQRDLEPFDDDWPYHVALNKGGRIWIVPSKLDERGEYLALVIHEIGHHLGLNHVDDVSMTYMHTTINDTPRSLWHKPAIPERDRREFCAVRGCACAW